MIDKTLQRIVDELNKKFNIDGSSPVWFGFPTEMPGDAVKLRDNVVNILLIRIEEERVMRMDERYYQRKSQPEDSNNPKGVSISPPPMVLHLYILLAARFANYQTGLQRLSEVITFFQANPIFGETTLSSGEKLPELRLELHSPSFTTQNEIWSTLKAPIHPSVLYKVSLALLKDPHVEIPAPIRTVEPARIQDGDTLTNEIKKDILNHSQ